VAPIEEVTGGLQDGAAKEAKDKSKMVSLDDFELMKVIGRGSYAKVLMVELKSTGRVYAMKVIYRYLPLIITQFINLLLR